MLGEYFCPVNFHWTLKFLSIGLRCVQFDDSATLDSLLDEFFSNFDTDGNGLYLTKLVLFLFQLHLMSFPFRITGMLSFSEFASGLSWAALARLLSFLQINVIALFLTSYQSFPAHTVQGTKHFAFAEINFVQIDFDS
jgi:hypothetical protein